MRGSRKNLASPPEESKFSHDDPDRFLARGTQRISQGHGHPAREGHRPVRESLASSRQILTSFRQGITRAPHPDKRSRFFQVQSIVKQAGDEASGQRTNPVNAVVSPVIRGQGRPKRSGGIQGGAGERAGYQNANRNGEADAEAGDGFERALFIDGRGKNDEHEKESG